MLNAHLLDEDATFDSYICETSLSLTVGGELELLLLSIALNLRIGVYLGGAVNNGYRRIAVYGKSSSSREPVRRLFSPEK